MTFFRHQPLSTGTRFLLVLLGLVMLQWNVPVQRINDLAFSADFSFIQRADPGAFQICSSALSSVASGLEFYRSQITADCFIGVKAVSPAKSFRIVSVSSRKSSAGSSWPVNGMISSGYGMRRHPVTRRNSFHNGIDIKARQGTSILSPADGVVVSAGRAGLMGRMVKVRTKDGKTLYFGHMYKIKCRKGDAIRRGQLLGTVGSSGRATGPHLHFSVVSSGRYINPLKYLSAD